MTSILQMRRMRLSRFHDLHKGKDLLQLVQHFFPRSSTQHVFVGQMSPTTILYIKMVTFFIKYSNGHILINQPINFYVYLCNTQIYIHGTNICVCQTTQAPLKVHSSFKDNKEINPQFSPVFHTVRHHQKQKLRANNPFLVNQISSLTYHFL